MHAAIRDCATPFPCQLLVTYSRRISLGELPCTKLGASLQRSCANPTSSSPCSASSVIMFELAISSSWIPSLKLPRHCASIFHPVFPIPKHYLNTFPSTPHRHPPPTPI